MWELILISILTFLASFIGTVTSFGTATIMTPVLINFYSFNTVLLFTGIIHWFGNIWKMLFFKKGINLRLLLLFGIPGIIVSYLGAQLVISIDKTVLARTFGIILFLYISILANKPIFNLPVTNLTAIAGGGISGFLSGILGIGGAVRAAFLLPFKLEKEEFIFTAGAIGFLIDSSRLVSYLYNDFTITKILLYGLFLYVPLSYLGAYLAKKAVGTISQKKFRLVVGTALLLLSLKLAIAP